MWNTTSVEENEQAMSKVLLLNSDDEPLNLTSWKRALVLIIKGKAEYSKLLDNIDDYIQIDNTYIPKVIRLTYDLAVPCLELPFSRENIFIRDDYTCQYCGKRLPASELTLDHVFPKSRFGPDIWENIVACCKECNQHKADRTPKEAHMKLLRRPYRPNDYFEFERKKFSKKEAYLWEKYFNEKVS
ncbi:MAG: HNH endonuclease [Candidatus Gastranaerophilales bacterium]|nr:HNH endonuclease [Candidatus Gastranaerophilales bacterium]